MSTYGLLFNRLVWFRFCAKIAIFKRYRSTEHSVTSSCTDLARRCNWLPDTSWVLLDRDESDQVLRQEYVCYTTACQNNASRLVAEHLTCNQHSRDLHAHTTRAASDHTGPLSWQQRCCLRSLAESRPLRSSHGSLKQLFYLFYLNICCNTRTKIAMMYRMCNRCWCSCTSVC